MTRRIKLTDVNLFIEYLAERTVLSIISHSINVLFEYEVIDPSETNTIPPIFQSRSKTILYELKRIVQTTPNREKHSRKILILEHDWLKIKFICLFSCRSTFFVSQEKLFYCIHYRVRHLSNILRGNSPCYMDHVGA